MRRVHVNAETDSQGKCSEVALEWLRRAVKLLICALPLLSFHSLLMYADARGSAESSE